MSNFNLSNFMDGSIKALFQDALGASLSNPKQALFLRRALKHQIRAAKKRQQHEHDGTHVPPFIIFSITHKCNLSCVGCYEQAMPRRHSEELDAARFEGILSEAKELGVSIVLLAGGEPLVRKDEVLGITARFPEIMFPLFTNGMLIDETLMSEFAERKNLIPVISIEGYQEDTDLRRGDGVFQSVASLFKKMKTAGLFYGTSITLTRSNFETVTGEPFLTGLMSEGCRLFFFIEYVPVKPGTEHWVLTSEQQASVPLMTAKLRQALPGLFIAFPGDEEALGGCLAAGRGFVHISPDGSLEACPFAPYSDTTLKNLSLRDALNSPLLRTIRENHSLLAETKGGCTLWENREWLQTICSEETVSQQ